MVLQCIPGYFINLIRFPYQGLYRRQNCSGLARLTR